MNGTLILMIVGPLIIPLAFALPPLIGAALIHLDEAREETLRRAR